MKNTPKMIRVGMLLALGLPLAAQAGVEVYGQARPSVDFVNNNENTAGQKDAKLSLSSNASRIGFKGDEDLGNGLALKWQLENQVDFDTGVAFAKQRNTFVGVGGGFGTVLAGKLDTPYKSSTQYLDIFVDTVADFSAVMNYGHDLRVGNTLAYVTPDMNGFKGSVAYVMSIANGDDNLPKTSTQNDQDAFSLSGNYSNGPLSLLAAYETLSKLGSGGDDATAWKIGGSYTIMDATTIGLIYENTDVAGTIKDRNAFYINAAHKMGATTLKLAYGNIDKCGGSAGVCDQTGATQMSVGASQALTKNTEVYALYTQVSNDNNAGFGLVSSSLPVVGQDMSAFSVGLNHTFSSK
jgi:predicted porin